jgi:hypothetical protein
VGLSALALAAALAASVVPAPGGGVALGASVSVPSTIDASGGSDVSSKLQSFINSQPNGTTINFKAGGTYRLAKAVIISAKRGLILDGNGARINMTGTTGDFRSVGFQVRDGSSNTIREFTMVGNNPYAGTSSVCCSKEMQHAIAILSAADTTIENVNISRTWGDCVYVQAHTGGVWPDGVIFRNSRCTLSGRHGVGIIAGQSIRITGNVFDQLGFDVVDIEPNASRAGANDVVVSGNTIGTYGLTHRYIAKVLAAGGPDTGAAVRNVTFTGNTVKGNKSGYNGDVLGLNVVIKGDRGPRSGFTITNNVAGMTARGPLMTFTQTSGVVVTGNRQPLSSGTLATFSGGSNITYKQ